MRDIRIYNAFKKLVCPYLPVELYGAWEYRCHTEMRNSMGGPFNGQKGRQSLVKSILKEFTVEHIVETGTHRGTTTAFLREHSAARIYTMESSRHFWGYSAYRFMTDNGVTVMRGDSRRALRKVIRKLLHHKSNPIFFYLDAHWEEDLPLREELEIIFSSSIDAIVMIDDFKVPDDGGYSYDDYGIGKALTVEYIDPVTSRYGLDTYFPSVCSENETGAKRGSVTLVKCGTEVSHVLNGFPDLYHWSP